jgi:hypothetical protein
MVDPPKCEQLLNRLPAHTPERSGGHLCVAMTSIAQLICAFWELLIRRESGGNPALHSDKRASQMFAHGSASTE